MNILELLEARNNSKRNKMLYFRQTVDSILEKVEGKILVVFDTETSGLSVHLPWVQVTEIAAVAFDMNTGQEIDRFHSKIRLTPATRAEIAKQERNQRPNSTPDVKDGDRGSLEGPKGMAIRDLFKMSGYGDPNAPFGEIRQVYTDWVNWLNKFNGPILLGQNVGFDMGHMFAPLAKLGIKRPNIGEVLDTMTLARTWIYPLLKSAGAAGDQVSAQMAAGFEVPQARGGTRLSFTLGKLGDVFGVAAGHWHSGISDAMQTYEIFSKMLEVLRQSKEHGHDQSDTFKNWHTKMSGQAFTYGKRPAFQSTIDSDTKKGIKARRAPRLPQ